MSSDVTFFNHFSSSVGEIPLNLSSSFTRVNSVRFHVGDETHKVVVYDNLMYSGSFRLGDCGVKYVGTIHMSSERPTPVDFLRELGRLIQWDHGPTCVTVAQKFQDAEKDADDVSTKRPVDEEAASLNANDVT